MIITELAWLAGLLEGEGCFGLSGSKGSARISLNMTDKDIVERVAKIFNTTVKLVKRYPNRKQVYRVEIFSNKAIAWMLTLWIFMGSRRRTRIEESLSFWKTQRLKNPQGMGRRNPRCEAERKRNEDIIARH